MSTPPTPTQKLYGGTHKTNCLIEAPGYTNKALIITGLGYGKTIVSSTTEARRMRAWYPKIAESEEWFVEALFGSYTENLDFLLWMKGYFDRITNPDMDPLPPMTVKVPSQNFARMGYPSGALHFGDSYGKIVYRMQLTFASVADGTIDKIYASKFAPALKDAAAAFFYPVPVSIPTSPYTGNSSGSGPRQQ